jgi:predicted site-specific integrase-resolvase
LERQRQALELLRSQSGWTFELMSDSGSGMNRHKKGPAKPLNAILADDAGRIASAREGRPPRLGAEPAFSICEAENAGAAAAGKGGEPPFEEGPASGAPEIIAAFSARLYGSRGEKSEKLLEDAAKAAADGAEGAQNKDAPEQRAGSASSESMRSGAARLQPGIGKMDGGARRRA